MCLKEILSNAPNKISELTHCVSISGHEKALALTILTVVFNIWETFI